MICKVCGDEYPEEKLDDGICLNCMASIIHSEDMPPYKEDFI